MVKKTPPPGAVSSGPIGPPQPQRFGLGGRFGNAGGPNLGASLDQYSNNLGGMSGYGLPSNDFWQTILQRLGRGGGF